MRSTSTGTFIQPPWIELLVEATQDEAAEGTQATG